MLPSNKTGVLLVNLGSPKSPTYSGLYKYLRQFLSDPRVIETPRWIWNPILYGAILPFRSKPSADKYKNIWTPEGAPLIALTEKVASSLQTRLDADQSEILVRSAMRYGEPSVSSIMQNLRTEGIRRLLVLPMYPQPAAATVASVADAVFDELKHWRTIPDLRFIGSYHDHPLYIKSIAETVRAHWQKHDGQPADMTVVSFHGMPIETRTNGDWYPVTCEETYRLMAEKLGIPASKMKLVYQSRFGPAEWLQPYCEEYVDELALKYKEYGTVDFIAPGFSIDCLETTDEIDREYREQFIALRMKTMKAEGKEVSEEALDKAFRYIPALNDTQLGIALMEQLVRENLGGWVEHVEEETAGKM